MMTRALEQAGYALTTAATVTLGIQALESGAVDLVLTDLKLPDGSGLDIVAAVRRCQPRTPCLVITGFGTVTDAVEAMKRGAADFLEKPLDLEQLYAVVERHLHGDVDVFQPAGAPPIVGRHPTLRTALRLIEKVAPTESTVLLTGESGTGKELAASALHALSQRSTGPFVAVNCAALPESLVENELFGHEKGAYTGADRRSSGYFEKARGGTLFLDEVGELPLGAQGKVLRVIEERVFERVGGRAPVRADVRLVAATNRDLSEMVGRGTFRSDLLYRLDVFPITLPPLRARKEDIPLLVRHLLDRLASNLGRPAPTLDAAAEAVLIDHDWPGNVRQLANVLERASIVATGPRLDVAEVETALSVSTANAGTEPSRLDERSTIEQVLRETDGDKRAAAERLDISYRTLQRKIRQLDLEGIPRYR